MAVSLPSTTLHVLTPDVAQDAHGHTVAHSWLQRGPYQAHLARPQHREDTDRERQLASWTVQINPEAWPLDSRHVLVTAEGKLLQVVGARLVADLPVGGPDISHVSASCTEVRNVAGLEVSVADGVPVQLVMP